MANVNLTTQIRDFKGKTLKDGTGDLLLRGVLLAALSNGSGKENTFEKKAKLFEIGVKIATCDAVVELESKEIVLIKEAIVPMFSPLVVGQVGRILEGQPTGIPIECNVDKCCDNTKEVVSQE